MRHANCAPTTAFAKNLCVAASRHVATARKSTATSPAPSVAQVAAKAGAWRQARSCRRCAPGLPAKAARARLARELRVAMPRAVPPQAIVVLLAASRLAHAPVARTVVQAVHTAASVVSRVAPAVAIAHPAVGPHRAAVVHKVKVRRVMAIQRMATISPTATRHTATPVLRARVVRVRKVRVAIARKAPADRRAKAAIVHTAVADRKVTVDLRGDGHQVAVAIVRAIAESRLAVAARGS
jgi:hypothetical protein